jgi:hypothetical protein
MYKQHQVMQQRYPTFISPTPDPANCPYSATPCVRPRPLALIGQSPLHHGNLSGPAAERNFRGDTLSINAKPKRHSTRTASHNILVLSPLRVCSLPQRNLRPESVKSVAKNRAPSAVAAAAAAATTAAAAAAISLATRTLRDRVT